MMRKLKIGEIRVNDPPVVMESAIEKSPIAEIAGDQTAGVQESPPENRTSQEGEGFQTHQQESGCNDDMDNQCLHGNVDMTAHVNCNAEVDLETGPSLNTNNNNNNGPKDGGPDGINQNEPGYGENRRHGPEMVYEENNFMDDNGGPTPANCLGKRNRAERSPPSIGSVQGPTQRKYGESCRSDSVSLDLNNPMGVSSGNSKNTEMP
ncbi:hypothetical protein Hanom_Chr13g01222991 [Helianthus anomalus]